MDGRYDIGDVVLENWTLTKLIGEGSFGRVYEARREDFGRSYEAAIKIITIPQSQSEVEAVRDDGMNDESVTSYFRGFVEELVDEFDLMSKLKGDSNVVSYEDHTVEAHKDNIGWDIIIRMELLTPLPSYAREHSMARKDVIRLGIDMCKALELCQKFNIVHRDIKPENIFISDSGNYKLGDFGVARTVEKTTGGLSKKGTYTYMAPEVYKGEPYGSSVDIYSLGIVLYRLLNENRTPFLPAYPAPITHEDRENSLTRRISGEAIPAPKNADGRLAEIVLKACAYDPKDRYSSPMQMREELEAIQYSASEAAVIYPRGDETPIKSENNIPTDAPAPVPTPAPEPATEPAAVQTPAPEPEPVAEPEDEKTTGVFAAVPAFTAAETAAPQTELNAPAGHDTEFGAQPGTGSANYADEAEPAEGTVDAAASTPQPPKKRSKKEMWITIAAVLTVAAAVVGIAMHLNRTEKIYNTDGTYSVISYANGVKSKETDYDLDGNKKAEFVYNLDGNKKAEFVYNADGTHSEISYANGVKSKETDYDLDGNKTVTFYDANGVVLYYEYYPDGSSDIVDTYDSNDLLVKRTLYNSDGSCNSYYVYDYDGNRTLIKSTQYDAGGNVIVTVNWG